MGIFSERCRNYFCSWRRQRIWIFAAELLDDNSSSDLVRGFSALAIPFCFAIAAIRYKEQIFWMDEISITVDIVCRNDIRSGNNWRLLGIRSSRLGRGLLGMGSCWKFSLMPWIIISGNPHIQWWRRGKLRGFKNQVCPSIMAFVMVLYSTFLTEAEFWCDSSVHSFGSRGQEFIYFLWWFFFSLLDSSIIWSPLQTESKGHQQTSLLALSENLHCLQGAVVLSTVSTPCYSGRNKLADNFKELDWCRIL